KLWDTASGRELLAVKPNEGTAGHFQTGMDFVFSADGRSLLSVAAGAVRQFESLTGKVTRELSLFDGKGYGWAQFSPDGRFLATYDEAAELKVWDVARGALLQTQSYRPQQPDHKNLKTIKMVNLNAVAFSPDGRTIALSEDSQELMSRGAEITIR